MNKIFLTFLHEEDRRNLSLGINHLSSSSMKNTFKLFVSKEDI